MMNELLRHVQIDDVKPVLVGPGCFRRDLPSTGYFRAWIVEMDAGAVWPHVDDHDEYGEAYYVTSGELIEDEQVFRAGTYVLFGPRSSHRPRTEVGVRLFGFNLRGPLCGGHADGT